MLQVSYIHRIGRTGRGGRSGEAVTFFTNEDVGFLRSIANVMKQVMMQVTLARCYACFILSVCLRHGIGMQEGLLCLHVL